MQIEYLHKDISNICHSYLTLDEITYYKKEWYKFNKYNVCTTAAQNGWLDLLKWARKLENGSQAEWNSWTCKNAAENGHLEVLKWVEKMVVIGIIGHVVMQL